MIKSSALEFHETFQPELPYIAKILKLASENYSGTKFEISDCTGIPTGKQKGKVEPHIRYARCMGLIDYSIENGVYSDMDNKGDGWWFYRKTNHVPSGSGELFAIGEYWGYYLNNNVTEEDKVIYLTLDCGFASANTAKILDI